MDTGKVMKARAQATRKHGGNRHWRKGPLRKKDNYRLGNSPKEWRNGMNQTTAPDFGSLIPVNPSDRFPVDARKLHVALGNTADFPTWWDKRIRRYGLMESVDFEVFHQPLENPNGGRPARNYRLTIEAGKEMAMVEGSPVGKQVRAYFIECERRLHEDIPRVDVSRITHLETAQALVVAIQERDRLAEQIEEQRPRVEFAEAVNEAGNTISMAEAAQRLGWGHYRLMARLRDLGILIGKGPRRNHPYQEHIDAGRFTLHTGTYDVPSGETYQYGAARVTGKGLEWLHGVLNGRQVRAIN